MDGPFFRMDTPKKTSAVRKSTAIRELALGRAHTHEPTLSRIRAPVDSETAIVVNGGKAREREVSDAKGNSSTKASVVITRPSCLIDSPSIIQSRKQSQRPLKKDDFYFKILSWTVKMEPRNNQSTIKLLIRSKKDCRATAISLEGVLAPPIDLSRNEGFLVSIYQYRLALTRRWVVIELSLADLAPSSISGLAFRTEGRILGWNQKSTDRTDSTGTEADKR
ncbi:hypothetical protein E3N88_28735 [Mikania micrantha]|uniref:Uncharacterized protein n=1 Tax=Mikania micrantha TaxID=192012 RepID=A0A5N6N1X6_9ASTR|nr:hypothetical protein E3N88_28735 [Mikania micrantha]